MGNGLSLPYHQSSDSIRPHTIIEIFAVADLLDSVSEYFRSRTRKEKKQARQGRGHHRRDRRSQQAWSDSASSGSWNEGCEHTQFIQCAEARLPCHEPKPPIYNSIAPTSHRRQRTYSPWTPLYNDPSRPSYHPSSTSYHLDFAPYAYPRPLFQENSRPSLLNDDYAFETRNPRRRRSFRRHHPNSGIYDNRRSHSSEDVYHDEPPTLHRRQRPRQHHHQRHADSPPDRYQSRSWGTLADYQRPVRSASSRSWYRSPSLPPSSDERHDLGTLRDESLGRFRGRDQREESIGGLWEGTSTHSDRFR